VDRLAGVHDGFVSLKRRPVAVGCVGRPVVKGAAMLGSSQLGQGVVRFVERGL
jgi:hypothetical protein